MIMFHNRKIVPAFYYLLSTLLLLFYRIHAVNGGVKIEVSPLKTVNTTMNLASLTNNSEPVLPPTTSTEPTTTTKGKTQENVTGMNEMTTIKITTLSSTITTQSPTLTTPVANSTKSLNDANSTQFSLVNRTLYNETINFLNQFTKRKLRQDQILSSYYCPCDLKINYCDVNCCCDIDCVLTEVRLTFKCDDQNLGLHDYEEMSGLESCSVSDSLSLLCVVDRKPRLYSSEHSKQIKIDFQQAAKYNWMNRFQVDPIKTNEFRNYYKAGDQILTWNEEDKDIHNLDVPRSLMGNKCEIKSPIKHLTDLETKCIQTPDEHEKFILDFEEKLRQLKILKTPPTLPSSVIHAQDICNNSNPLNKTESSNCIEIQIYHCNRLITPRHCMSNATDIDNSENVLAKDIQIRFHHNFTSITGCTVFFVYTRHVDNVAWSSVNILQTIRIEYLELNETYADRSVHRVSGNIGYLLHNPIIITKYISLNSDGKTDKTEKVLGYFHENTTFFQDEHYIKIPKIDRNGNCVINNYTYDMINFGENFLMTCKAVFPKANSSNEFAETQTDVKSDSNKNLTSVCKSFQKTILKHLIYDFDLEQENSTVYDRFNVHISEFGNPKNETNSWTQLKTLNSPVKLDEIIAAGLDENLNTFICKNMFLNVRYEFFFGRLRVGKIPHQALIKDVNIKFGPKIDLKLKLDGDFRPVPIYLDAIFHDFTQAVINRSCKMFYSGILVLIGLLGSVYL